MMMCRRRAIGVLSPYDRGSVTPTGAVIRADRKTAPVSRTALSIAESTSGPACRGCCGVSAYECCVSAMAPISGRVSTLNVLAEWHVARRQSILSSRRTIMDTKTLMSPNPDQVRDQQRETWDRFSVGWKKWDAMVLGWLGPYGAAMI